MEVSPKKPNTGTTQNLSKMAAEEDLKSQVFEKANRSQRTPERNLDFGSLQADTLLKWKPPYRQRDGPQSEGD